jgi:sugar lactone lactonase YvrE
VVWPTGAGDAKRPARAGIEQYGESASWFPDGQRVLFVGREKGRAWRCFAQNLNGGDPRAVTPEGVVGRLISPDGQYVVAAAHDGKESLYPVEGGATRAIPGLLENDEVAGWSSDGTSWYVYRQWELPMKVYRLELGSGRRELLHEIVPSETNGILWPPSVLLTPDGKSYLYQLRTYHSELYLVEGLK